MENEQMIEKSEEIDRAPVHTKTAVAEGEPHAEKKSFLKAVDFLKIARLIVVLFAALVQVYLLAAYLSGTVAVFGKSVTAIGAVNFILEIFNITMATIYRRIAGLVIGIVYFILLGFIVKATFQAAQGFIGSVAHFGVDDDPRHAGYLKKISYANFYSFMMICIFIVASRLFGVATIERQTIGAMILTGLIIPSREFLTCYAKKENFHWQISFLTAVKETLIFICLCMLVYVTQSAMLDKFVRGCKMLINGGIFFADVGARPILYSLFSYMLLPIFEAILSVKLMNLIFGYISFIDRGKQLTRGLITLLTLAAVFMILHLIFTCFIGGDIKFFHAGMIWNYFGLVKNSYVPTLILLGAWLYLQSKKINYV